MGPKRQTAHYGNMKILTFTLILITLIISINDYLAEWHVVGNTGNNIIPININIMVCNMVTSNSLLTSKQLVTHHSWTSPPYWSAW